MKTPKMMPQKGKVYRAKGTYVMCTGEGKTDYAYTPMAGVVVKQDDPFSDHQFGDHSSSWNFDVFVETDEPIILDNKNWVEPKEIGCSPG